MTFLHHEWKGQGPTNFLQTEADANMFFDILFPSGQDFQGKL
jgi:hypothetical protein